MRDLVSQLHDLIDTVVFGNGWLALGGLVVVGGIVLAVRLLPPVRV
ncbi:hypothetical protein JQN72_14820 [Phycicoccus sp. CSK15P-2]|nr:hypothetical protein [Phycicoccus sp. CSK15P-2]MBM6405516.1 hypothetical protein [Phycicoccus sp. CSK15P-2]